MALRSCVDATVRSDRVEFALTVENAGAEPVELTFRSGLAADFAVCDDGEAWRASGGRAFAQALRTATLAPGGVETYAATWAAPDPGEYAVVARLNVVARDVSARTEFSVP